MADSLYENLFSVFDGSTALPINDNAYATVLHNIETIDSGTIQQPVVIIGEFGSGKSFLLKQLYSALITESDKYYPVLIEGLQLFSNSDIFRICAERIGVNYDGYNYKQVIEWQHENKIRLVILIDNIQYYFKRTDKKEHYALRGVVNSPESPMIVGTSNEVIPQFVDYDEAFFEGMKLCYLKPISEDKAMELIPKGRQEQFLSLYRYIPKTIRNIKIAEAAGNRTVTSEQFTAAFLEYFSEYFRLKYDSCLLQEQRILYGLTKSPDGLTLKELRDTLNQDNTKISPYLGIMVDKGLILRDATSPRKARYKIKDGLFRIWLLNISGGLKCFFDYETPKN